MRVHGWGANVVLIGGPGTGKTHVATALGIQAIEHHRQKVRFFSTIELGNALEKGKGKAKGEAGQIAETLVRLGEAFACPEDRTSVTDTVASSRARAARDNPA